MQPPEFVVWEQYVTVADIKQYINNSVAAIRDIICINTYNLFRTLWASLPVHAALPHLDNRDVRLLNFPELKPPSKKPG